MISVWKNKRYATSKLTCNETSVSYCFGKRLIYIKKYLRKMLTHNAAVSLVLRFRGKFGKRKRFAFTLILVHSFVHASSIQHKYTKIIIWAFPVAPFVNKTAQRANNKTVEKVARCECIEASGAFIVRVCYDKYAYEESFFQCSWHGQRHGPQQWVDAVTLHCYEASVFQRTVIDKSSFSIRF